MAKKKDALEIKELRRSKKATEKELKKQQEERAEDVRNIMSEHEDSTEEEEDFTVEDLTPEERAKEAEKIRQAIADVDNDIEAEKKREIQVMAINGRNKAQSDDRAEANAKVKAKELSSVELDAQADQIEKEIADAKKKIEVALTRKHEEIKKLRQLSKEKAAAEEQARKEQEAREAEEARKAEEARLAARKPQIVYRYLEEGKKIYVRDAAAAEQASPGRWDKVFVFIDEDGIQELTQSEITKFYSIV